MLEEKSNAMDDFFSFYDQKNIILSEIMLTI
jgi:hypothetical protein